MALTLEQLKTRQNFVGASDSPVLFNLSRFKTLQDLWRSKVEPPQVKPETPATRMGNLLEPVVMQLAEDALNAPPSAKNIVSSIGRMGASFDGVLRAGQWTYRTKIQDRTCLIEAKTCGFAGEVLETWGRGGTEDVPPRVLMQAQHQLHVAQCFPSTIGEDPKPEICWVSLLSGHDGRGHRMYRIKYNKSVGERIENVCNQFWKLYVEPRIEPPIFVEWQ